MSVTDHDTLAGLAEARAAAASHGIRLVDGIEMTAVDGGRDVHVLGYFFDPDDETLDRFLRTQRLARIERVQEIAAPPGRRSAARSMSRRCCAAAPATSGRSVGRPARRRRAGRGRARRRSSRRIRSPARQRPPRVRAPARARRRARSSRYHRAGRAASRRSRIPA